MLEDRTLTRFADLLQTTTGLATPEPNRSHLRRMLSREIRYRGVTAEQLLSDCLSDRRTLQQIIDVAMIGETYFFREATQFHYLRQVVLPQLVQERQAIAAWSASCSTGEEAISLAVLMHDAAQPGGEVSITVHAADIRSNVLERIRRGEYPHSSLRRDGSEFHELFRSTYIASENEQTFTVSPEILDLIQTQTINVFADPLEGMPDAVDIVFFRNTLIYAPADNRVRIVHRIASRIRPGGYLFLANSELPFVSHPELELVDGNGVYCFRKRTNGETPHISSTGTATGEHRQTAASTPLRESERWSMLRVLQAVAGSSLPNPPALRDTARLLEALFADLDAERFDRADEYLRSIARSGADRAVVEYCSGWIAYAKGSPEPAITGLTAALEADDGIWPARFYRARLIEETDCAAARAEYCACITEISRGPSGQYSFLVGGFDPAQIRALCIRSTERIDAGKAGCVHGS